MYRKINSPIALIDGSRGAYDKAQIKNPSVRYGRNAGRDYYNYRQQVLWNATDITKYEYRYMPGLKFNRPALLGNAYEILNRSKEEGSKFDGSLDVKYIDDKYKKSGEGKISVAALDLDENGKIDTKEMAVALVAKDTLSTVCENTDMLVKYSQPKFTDGVINEKGDKGLLKLLDRRSTEESREIFREIADNLKLDDAVDNFFANKSNTVESPALN